MISVAALCHFFKVFLLLWYIYWLRKPCDFSPPRSHWLLSVQIRIFFWIGASAKINRLRGQGLRWPHHPSARKDEDISYIKINEFWKVNALLFLFGFGFVPLPGSSQLSGGVLEMTTFTRLKRKGAWSQEKGRRERCFITCQEATIAHSEQTKIHSCLGTEGDMCKVELINFCHLFGENILIIKILLE